MTNTTTTDLKARATLAIAPLAPVGVAPTTNHFATVEVQLPDGSTGVARATDVLSALHLVSTPSAHWILVAQGGRMDVWHVTQLA